MKTETKVEHTAAPWEIVDKAGVLNDLGKEIYPAAKEWGIVANLHPMKKKHVASISNFDYDNESENEANARLISSAPELLDALENIISDANSADYEGGFSEAAHIKAKEAIAKARGL